MIIFIKICFIHYFNRILQKIELINLKSNVIALCLPKNNIDGIINLLI